MMGKNILLVDDDALLRRSLAFNLQRAGYDAQTAATAEDALEVARRSPPDLVLLDIGLPGMDGLEALRSLRQLVSAPVIMLTARRRELDQVLGLELGADDYVTKPFDLDVLLARVKAVLRRSSAPPLQAQDALPIEAGDLRIDSASHVATVCGQPLALSPREFDLLAALALKAGQVVTTEALLAQVWGAEFEGQPQVVYVHVRWLREKMEQDPNHPERILTVRGVGYKLIPREVA